MLENQIIEKIRENNYTPFEAMLYIHKLFSKNYRIDYENCSHESREATNQIQRIITALSLPGLTCDINFAEISKDQVHFFNIIQLDDPKYFIHGVYANDTIRDASSHEFCNGKGFAHCLFPVHDINHIKNINCNHLQKHTLHPSDPILPPTFISGLRKIHDTAPELCCEENFNEFIYNEINNSIITASEIFDKDAISKFAICAKSPILCTVENQNKTAIESQS